MTKTRLGSVALACAALGDVIAWCLLAFVVGVVQTTAADALPVALLTVLFIAAVFVVVRPIMVRWVRTVDEQGADRGALAMALIAMLAGALTTEAIGIHAIFGAFLIGSVIPHDSRLAGELERSIGGLVSTLLLPAFFAFAGMRTEIGLLSGAYEWAVCALIVVVATAGKLGGVVVGARVSGYRWSDAFGLGVLMNTRGLMELIVLNVGLDLGVISPTLFAMLVLMALATTMAASPLLQLMQGQAWNDVTVETSTPAAPARVGGPRAS
jgi:Kef-type K+ transport system membrane component KefB